MNLHIYFKAIYVHPGKKPIEDMLEDPQMTAEIYSNYQKYENRNSIIINGEFVPIKRERLCRKLAKHLCSENQMSFPEFFVRYTELLKAHGLDNNEKLTFPSERAFEARLQDSMYVLMKYGRKMRYYPIHEYDIEEFVDSLHFEQYHDIEISTLKIFTDYLEVMSEYNILDEYELHNLLNKTKDIWNRDGKYAVELTRMSFIVFGNADRAKQTEWLLSQIAPVSYEEFGAYYEAEFGVRANTANANMGPLISKYYHSGFYTVDQPLLTNEESVYMHEKLDAEFYFISDVQSIFISQFGETTISHLNPRTYKELGYKVFTNYLIKNIYSSADEYFSKLFTRDSLLNMNDFDSRLIYVQSANQALDNLRANYDMLEYEDKKYVSFSHFSDVVKDITKEDFAKYVKDAIAASGADEFLQ